MVDDRPILEVFYVVPAIVRSIAVRIIQLQIHHWRCELVQRFFIVTGWFLHTCHPGLHVDEIA